MRIAYFITGLGLGGAEIVTIGIVNNMVHRGHKVMIVYLNGNNEHNDIIDPHIEVIGLDMHKTPLGMLQALRQAARLMRQFRPDVVHGNMIHANIFVRLLRLFVRLPKVVCSEHSIDIRGKGRMWAYRLTDFLSDVNTNVSQEATDHFIKSKAFGAKKSRTMYNGIDTSTFVRNKDAGLVIRKKYDIGQDEFLWLNVGRLTEAKDHNTLLKAFSQVEHGKLLLLGKGELESQINAQITALKLADRVIMAGAHSNTVDYYSAADALVLSSAWEGLPTVVLEAMSCSLPIVTTNVGAANETIGDKRWIVPSRNPMALKDKMNQMIALSSKQREEIGKQNRISVQRFDIENICTQWEAIYKTPK